MKFRKVNGGCLVLIALSIWFGAIWLLCRWLVGVRNMRITKDYGLTASKLEHDLLVRLNKAYKPVNWKRGLIKLCKKK